MAANAGAGGASAVLAPIADLRKTSFVLWSPQSQITPSLVIGEYSATGSFDVTSCRVLPMEARVQGLWALDLADGDLDDGVYGYWFQVADLSSPVPGVVLMTDPLAFAVDRANPAPPPRTNDGWTVGAPASVVRVRQGALEPSDPITADMAVDDPDYRARLCTNTQMVIYELPPRWVKETAGALPTSEEIGVGTFRDVLALVSPDADSPNFAGIPALTAREHIIELGINALELLPPADSPQTLEWGYGTANYFAADFDLGHQEGTTRSSATADLRALISACHASGIRFIQDVVMAFQVDNPYLWISPQPLLGEATPFGGQFWTYHAQQITGYDPLSGGELQMWPARQYMLVCVAYWLSYFHIDGARLDYVDGINDWDFIGNYSALARSTWRDLGGTDDRFWIVGEELSQPALFVAQGRADASWDETFKSYVRYMCVGVLLDGRDLGDAVSYMIDCTRRGFSDGRMVVNYIGSHDVGNTDGDRFYNWLDAHGVADKAPRFRLALVCLLTAVGVPMILAGDEFAAQRVLAITDPTGRLKQIDPIDFRALGDSWRSDLFAFAARMVMFRTTAPALARNECQIIHVDTTSGRLVVAWQRGVAPDLVVVVANFSDFTSEGGLAGEYVIPGWPVLAGVTWTEVSQNPAPRPVASPGREPLFPWEAKVYASQAGSPPSVT